MRNQVSLCFKVLLTAVGTFLRIRFIPANSLRHGESGACRGGLVRDNLWLTIVFFFLLPVMSSAQFTVGENGSLATAPNALVSVRNLSIPSSALNAFQEGIDRLKRADYAGGAQKFQQAIKKFPAYYEAYFFLASAHMSLDREDEAAAELQKSADLSGGRYPLPFFALGLLLCNRMDFAQANDVVQKGFELDNASWFGYYALGRVSLGLNRLDDAENYVHEAISRISSNPNLAQLYLLLAHIHERRHRHAELLEDLNSYLALETDTEMLEKVEAVRDRVKEVLKEEQRNAATPQPSASSSY